MIKRFEVDFFTHVPNLLLKRKGDLKLEHTNTKGQLIRIRSMKCLQPYDMCLFDAWFLMEPTWNIEYETIFPTRTIPFLLFW